MQGDIVGIFNEAGTRVVTYAYDAWGVSTVSYLSGYAWVSNANPFRYRGYYYDAEIYLYYLNSRYYDYGTGRFISADVSDVLTATPMALTDKNLYAYCDNNPVVRRDDGGEFWVTLGIMAVGGLIGGAISGISSAVTQQITTGSIDWGDVAISAASGFASGAVSASPLGVVGQAIGGAVVSGATYLADTAVHGEEFSVVDAVVETGIGAVFGLLGGSGYNYNKTLTNTVKNTGKTLAREARRANEDYTRKAIASAISYRNSTLQNSAWAFTFDSIGGETKNFITHCAYGLFSAFIIK